MWLWPRQTVSELTAELDLLAKKLLKANEHHNKQVTDLGLERIKLQEKINAHSHEADRAIRIHTKINELLS